MRFFEDSKSSSFKAYLWINYVLNHEISLESEISSIAVCAGSGASVLVNAGKEAKWPTEKDWKSEG